MSVWGLAALCACGEVVPSSAPDDAPPGERVKVTVLSEAQDGRPDAAARVVFQDPDGALVAEGAVDAAGSFEAVVPAGSTVSAIRTLSETATQRKILIESVRGVQPGDDLTIGFKAAPGGRRGGQTAMTVSFTPVADSTHEFYTPCGAMFNTVSPVTLPFFDSCHGDAFDVLVVVRKPTGETPKFVFIPSVAHRSGATFSVPAATQLMSDYTVTALNTPVEVKTMSARRFTLLESAAVAIEISQVLGDPPAGTNAMTVPFAPNAGVQSLVSIDFTRSDGEGDQSHSVRTANLQNNASIDLARNRLPFPKDVQASTTGLSWTPGVPGDAPDGALMIWPGSWTEQGVKVELEWRVAQALDNTTTAIPLPTLPPAYANLEPRNHADVTIGVPGMMNAGMLVADYDIFDGYDQYRQQAETFSLSFQDIAIDAPSFGRRLATIRAKPSAP